MITSTKNQTLAFIPCKNKTTPNLGIIVPHGSLFDFLSLMCWYSFAVNYEFLNPILFFVGRPHNDFRTWGHKLNCRIKFLKSFESLEQIQKRFAHVFDESYILCMYNVFLIQENKGIFENSFVSDDMIFQKNQNHSVFHRDIPSSDHNKLIPIVKFNFADADLIANSIIHNSKAGKPFLAEKKALDESANEVKLDELYRRSRELYRILMEGYYEQ